MVSIRFRCDLETATKLIKNLNRMKQILKEEEIVGKTIKSNGYGDNAFCLIFTDGTFCIIKGSGWDENDVEFSDEEISLAPTLRNVSYLSGMGLITKEEAKEVKEKEMVENIKKQKEREYQDYLKLKSKYEK